MRRKFPFLLIFILILIGLAVWIVLPNNPGIHIGKINKDIQTRLGLDLVGGVQALLEADLPAETQISAESMQTARTIVENRVNGLGVTEAVVQKAGDRRIVVELPGETDPELALSTIKKTGLLEFVDFSQLSDAEINTLADQKITTNFGVSDSTQSQDSEIQTVSERVFDTIMTGAELKIVSVVMNQAGQAQVSFKLTDNGAKVFKDFTTNNVGKILAIVLDKKIISSPVIETPITDGEGLISGNFTVESANNLALQLRYGSLPIPLKVATSQAIGPTLGQDSLQKSLLAGIVGISVVILFMVLYYRLPGVVAALALVIYTLLTFAIYKYIPVTLTLPGIAGFVLSVGVAVDANILIFERMKEELRAGRSLSQSIDTGWRRAWSSIRDSNISTLITCVILFWFGSTFGASIVKGFSLTLAIGVGVSMFTAIVVARTFLHLILDNIDIKEHTKWFGV
jgi:preprotein translocase subunit SecD